MSTKPKCLHAIMREYGDAWICTECDAYFPPDFSKAKKVMVAHKPMGIPMQMVLSGPTGIEPLFSKTYVRRYRLSKK